VGLLEFKERLLDIVSRPQGANIEELGEHLGVDRRSVYRMLDLVDQLGFPLVDEKEPSSRKKRWKLLESYQLKLPNMTVPSIQFTMSEILGLYFLKGMEKMGQGTAMATATQEAFSKIELFLPSGLQPKLDKIRAVFVSGTRFSKDYSKMDEIIDKLSRSMIGQKTCAVLYHSFHDDKVRGFQIDPLHFFEREGGLYFFVRTSDYGDIRILAVERIKTLAETENTFIYPEDFDPDERLRSSFNVTMDDPVYVRIRFSADQARYIRERRWADEQTLEDEENGAVILSLHTSGWWDVKRWVLSFGCSAEVLEPEELKSEMLNDIIGIYRIYSDKAKAGHTDLQTPT
jgi:predicted DNA-binding transcriptional regulator YafY